MPRKSVSTAVIFLLVLLAAGVFYSWPNRNDFQLQDYQGREFSTRNLKGHWTLMFFGFTQCPMMCPLTMSALQEMYRNLEQEMPREQLPQVVLVTLDPERDSLERLREYVQAFNPRFIGLRGDKAQTVALMRKFHVIAVKMQADGGSDRYTLNHGGEILVFNPEGKMTASWAYPHTAKVLVREYKNVVGNG